MEAKKITLVLILMAASLMAVSQNLEIPQKEFSLSFSEGRVELSRGETGQLNIGVLKSKEYRNRKVQMGISSSVPKGVTIAFDPDKGNFDFTKANISVGGDAVPGTYWLILNATLSYKTKGSIVKLTIKE
jgi:hypothetical protein